MDVRILRRKVVLHKTSYSSATLHRKIKAGEFPPPLRLGPNMCGWLESTVDDYINSLKSDNAIKPVAPGAKRGRKPKRLEVGNEK